MTTSRRAMLAGTAAAAGLAPLFPGAGYALNAGSEQTLFRPAMDYAVAKLREVAPRITGFPMETKFEKWVCSDHGGWVGGFWPGLLWLAWLDCGDPAFARLAREAALRLAPRCTDTGTHDLGFLFYPSWVAAWRLTGEPSWRDGAVQAANSLIQRYNPRGRFIRAWGALSDTNQAGRAIIDSMMNLDLLMFATEETGDPKYADIAVAHARTTARYFVRADGSSCHVFDFDPDTGAPIGEDTAQGYSPTSCWSRGQSWAVYGFTTLYRRTGDGTFRDVARRLADYLIAQVPADGVPVWDYRSPLAPNDIKDSSAGAIAACGLLDLAKATGDPRYHAFAVWLLNALCRTCLTTKSDHAEAVVARATRNRRAEAGIEVSLPYGDYYLVEGLMRLLRPQRTARMLAIDGA